jgi:hypothetical protein
LEDGDQEILCHGFSRINTDQKTTKDVSVKSVQIRGRLLGIDGHPIHAVGGIEHGLGQRGVGVNRPH